MPGIYSRLRVWAHQLHLLSRREHAPGLIAGREPVPLDPTRPTIACIPEDVRLHLLRFIQDTNPSAMHTIALLSSAFYHSVRYIQQHTVQIDLDKEEHAFRCLDIISRYNLLVAIRVLKISGCTGTATRRDLSTEEYKILSLLVGMLPGMTGLVDIHWQVGLETTSVPIPLPILRCLPPRVRLHTSAICNSGRDDNLVYRQTCDFLSQLIDNRNLFSLSIHITYYTESACVETGRTLKRVLLSCPNLVRIPLLHMWFYKSLVHGVVDGPSGRHPYCGLGLSGGERPPALEELGLSDYPWGLERLGTRSSFCGYYCVGYPERGIELEYWADTFDWSRLTTLRSFPKQLAMRIAPKLVCLQEVTFEEGFPNLAEFLEEIPVGLENLTFLNWGDIPNDPSSMIRHGQTLRRLMIHGKHEPWPANTLTTGDQLIGLCDELPHLEVLALELARDQIKNDWPYSTLDCIAKFPKLRNVELWFELGKDSDTPPIPHLTIFAARQLFRYLRERNKNIQRLELHAGFPYCHRIWCNFSEYTCWAKHNSVSFVCDISVFEGIAADGFSRVTCSNLSAEWNAELSRAAEEGSVEGLYEEAQKWPTALKVALRGPLTSQEWTEWTRTKK